MIRAPAHFLTKKLLEKLEAIEAQVSLIIDGKKRGVHFRQSLKHQLELDLNEAKYLAARLDRLARTNGIYSNNESDGR